MSLVTSSAAEKAKEAFYPESDGEPMAETPIHLRAIILLLQALEDFLAKLADVYIGANMFWYWEEGDPTSRRAPDVMVIKGVGRAERNSFFSWRENGAVPNVIFEIVSEKTWREDLFAKWRLYAQLGVGEYFLFDPEAAHLRPPLLGFRRTQQGGYVPLEPDNEDRLLSEELGLYLRPEGQKIRLLDAVTGEPVLSREERTEALAAEVARLKGLLGQRGGEAE